MARVCDAEAGGEVGQAGAVGDLGQRLLDAIDGAQGPLCRGAGEEEDELLAAEAGHDVLGAGRRVEGVGEGLEGAVAHLVAVGVVEALEVVDVRDDHSVAAPGGVELLDPLREGAPVEESGQLIGGSGLPGSGHGAEQAQAHARLLGDGLEADAGLLLGRGGAGGVQHPEGLAVDGDRQAEPVADPAGPLCEQAAGVQIRRGAPARLAAADGRAVAAALDRAAEALDRPPGVHGAAQAAAAGLGEQQLDRCIGAGLIQRALDDPAGLALIYGVPERGGQLGGELLPLGGATQADLARPHPPPLLLQPAVRGAEQGHPGDDGTQRRLQADRRQRRERAVGQQQLQQQPHHQDPQEQTQQRPELLCGDGGGGGVGAGRMRCHGSPRGDTGCPLLGPRGTDLRFFLGITLTGQYFRWPTRCWCRWIRGERCRGPASGDP